MMIYRQFGIHCALEDWRLQAGVSTCLLTLPVQPHWLSSLDMQLSLFSGSACSVSEADLYNRLFMHK